jgi:hypothetical protein
MSRYHSVLNVATGEETEVAFTADEEAAADAAEAAAEAARLVPKSTVTARIIDAGNDGNGVAYIKLAMDALTSNPAAWARWTAADKPAVKASDADTIALIEAIGLDPAAILAA